MVDVYCILVPELWETTTLGLMLNQLQSNNLHPLVIHTPLPVLNSFDLDPVNWSIVSSDTYKSLSTYTYDPRLIEMNMKNRQTHPVLHPRKVRRDDQAEAATPSTTTTDCYLNPINCFLPLLIPSDERYAANKAVWTNIRLGRWPGADLWDHHPRLDWRCILLPGQNSVSHLSGRCPGPDNAPTPSSRSRSKIWPAHLHIFNALLNVLRLWEWPNRRRVKGEEFRRGTDMYMWVADQFIRWDRAQAQAQGAISDPDTDAGSTPVQSLCLIDDLGINPCRDSLRTRESVRYWCRQYKAILLEYIPGMRNISYR